MFTHLLGREAAAAAQGLLVGAELLAVGGGGVAVLLLAVCELWEGELEAGHLAVVQEVEVKVEAARGRRFDDGISAADGAASVAEVADLLLLLLLGAAAAGVDAEEAAVGGVVVEGVGAGGDEAAAGEVQMRCDAAMVRGHPRHL